MRPGWAVAAVVSAVLLGFVTLPDTAETGLRGTPVGTVLLARDGRGIAVAQSGRCRGTGALRALETDTAVVLDFRTPSSTSTCIGGAELAVWQLRLTRPLGGRALEDANSRGFGVPYFRAADLPVAEFLPPGYRHGYDAPGYLGAASAGQWAPAASELFLDGTARLWLTVEYGRHWPDRWPATGALVAGHGHLARSGPGGLAWQQRDSCGVTLSFALLADPPLPTAQLERVADNLRPATPGECAA